MRRTVVVLMGLAMLVGLARDGRAADHVDSPSAVADGSADIADLFAWMSSDTTKVNLAMTVQPFGGSTFSDAVQYVFHINSSPGYGMPATETVVMCTFAADQTVQCWAGDEYVTGDASATAGITSTSGKLRVFAGQRNDPFFFNQAGFLDVVATVVSVAGGLTFDMFGCPALDAATSGFLVTTLGTMPDGDADETNNAPAQDAIAGTNVRALVIQIDTDLVNSGGATLGVWASTNAAN